METFLVNRRSGADVPERKTEAPFSRHFLPCSLSCSDVWRPPKYRSEMIMQPCEITSYSILLTSLYTSDMIALTHRTERGRRCP